METVGHILKSLFTQQRLKSGLSFDEITRITKRPKNILKMLEDNPAKVPLCELALLVEVYKIPHEDFLEAIYELQNELRPLLH